MGKGKKNKRPRRSFGGLEEDYDATPSNGRSKGRFDQANSAERPPAKNASPGLSTGSSIPQQAYAPGVGGTVHNDEWQTTRRTWAGVAEHFAAYKSQCVWMPFFYDGKCAEHLRSLGFSNVVHTDEDFFERVKNARFMKTVDFIWDNPPYTSQETKERVLRAMVSTGKPFALLLPVSVLHTSFVRDIVDLESVQCIVPRKTWVRKRDGAELGFKYLCWYCCRTALERDLVFCEDDDE